MNDDWRERLQTLCARFSHLGIGADLAALYGCAWSAILRVIKHAQTSPNNLQL